MNESQKGTVILIRGGVSKTFLLVIRLALHMDLLYIAIWCHTERKEGRKEMFYLMTRSTQVSAYPFDLMPCSDYLNYISGIETLFLNLT